MKKEVILFPAIALLFGIGVYSYLASRPGESKQEEPTEIEKSVDPTTEKRESKATSQKAAKKEALPGIGKKAEAPASKTDTPETPDVELQPFSFMGVVSVGDRRCGLLRRNDGSDPLRVRVGDVLDRWGFEVSKIEKHAIHLKKKDGSVLIVRNNQFP